MTAFRCVKAALNGEMKLQSEKGYSLELKILSSQRTLLLQSLVLEIPWNIVGGVPESDRMSGGLEN